MIMALTSFNDWQNLNDIKPLKLTNHTHKIYNTIKIFSKDDLGHQLTLEIKFRMQSYPLVNAAAGWWWLRQSKFAVTLFEELW